MCDEKRIIVDTFSQFEQVSCITMLESPQCIHVVVYTDNEKYDDALMDSFLEEEWRLSSEIDRLLDILYLPEPLRELYQAARRWVGKAEVIYMRGV